jgi:hypothetical protein
MDQGKGQSLRRQGTMFAVLHGVLSRSGIGRRSPPGRGTKIEKQTKENQSDRQRQRQELEQSKSNRTLGLWSGEVSVMAFKSGSSSVIAILFVFAISLFPYILDAQSTSGETPAGVVITRGTTLQGFPYLSGGVSSNEREIMEPLGKDYNLRITFAERGGSYLADVSLIITGNKGDEIVAVTANGPWFFIQLPPGRYTVKATFDGQTRSTDAFTVAKGKTVHRTLVWDLGAQSPN